MKAHLKAIGVTELSTFGKTSSKSEQPKARWIGTMLWHMLVCDMMVSWTRSSGWERQKGTTQIWITTIDNVDSETKYQAKFSKLKCSSDIDEKYCINVRCEEKQNAQVVNGSLARNSDLR